MAIIEIIDGVEENAREDKSHCVDVHGKPLETGIRNMTRKERYHEELYGLPRFNVKFGILGEKIYLYALPPKNDDGWVDYSKPIPFRIIFYAYAVENLVHEWRNEDRKEQGLPPINNYEHWREEKWTTTRVKIDTTRLPLSYQVNDVLNWTFFDCCITRTVRNPDNEDETIPYHCWLAVPSDKYIGYWYPFLEHRRHMRNQRRRERYAERKRIQKASANSSDKGH